jgi:hypothetical protein
MIEKIWHSPTKEMITALQQPAQWLSSRMIVEEVLPPSEGSFLQRSIKRGAHSAILS